MSPASARLAQRRQQLLLESDQHRQELSVFASNFRRNLASIDRGMSVLERLRRQPLLIAGLAFGIIVIKPQRILKKAQTALAIWHNVQRFLPIVQPLVQGLWQKWRTKNE